MPWPELLDTIEFRVAAYRDSLEHGTPAPPPLLIPGPEILGPIPPEERWRAESLLNDLRGLEARFAVVRDALADLIAGSNAVSIPGARYVDTLT